MWMSDRVHIITLESLLEFEEFIIFYTQTFLLDFFTSSLEWNSSDLDRKKFKRGFFHPGHYPLSTFHIFHHQREMTSRK